MTIAQIFIAVLGLGLTAAPVASLGQAQGGSLTGATAAEQSAPAASAESGSEEQSEKQVNKQLAKDLAFPFTDAGQETKKLLAKFLDYFHARDLVLAEQATYEQLGKLVGVLHERRRREESAIQDIESIIEQKEGIHLTPNQRVKLDALLYKHLDNFRIFYPIDDEISGLTGSFQKFMTRNDVDSAIAFYGSDAEQHSLALQPEVNEELMTTLGLKVLFGMPDADARIKDFTAELQKSESREKVDATFAFYRSPAGQHMIAALTIADLVPYSGMAPITDGDEGDDELKRLPVEVTNYLASLNGPSGHAQPEKK